MAYMLSCSKLPSRRRMRAVKHQKALASSRIMYKTGDARSDMPCSKLVFASLLSSMILRKCIRQAKAIAFSHARFGNIQRFFAERPTDRPDAGCSFLLPGTLKRTSAEI